MSDNVAAVIFVVVGLLMPVAFALVMVRCSEVQTQWAPHCACCERCHATDGGPAR